MKTGNWKVSKDRCYWLIGASLILTGSGSLTTAQATQVADPKATSPYAVGIVRDSITVADNVINSDGSMTPFTRTLPIYIFYPVDKSSVSDSSPRFNYEIFTSFIPNSRNTPLWREIPSAIWENNGVDRGYTAATASSHGPFPMIAFFNGGGCEATLHIKFHTHMATHGYVVGAVMWPDTDSGGGANCPKNSTLQNDRAVLLRSLNVKMMIDRALSRNSTTGDLLHGVIDAEKIAGASMSRGGRDLVHLISGLKLGSLPGENKYGALAPDPRIKALIALDSADPQISGENLKKVTVPVLALGTASGTAEDQFNAHSFNHHTARWHAMPSSDIKYRIDMRKTTHTSHIVSNCAYLYAAIQAGLVAGPVSRYDSQCNNPTQVLLEGDYQNTMFTYVIAFLRTHLENKVGYGDILTPGWTINADSNAEFFQSTQGGDVQMFRPANACRFIDGDFKFRLRQPGITTNNASTNRAETMFSDSDGGIDDDIKAKLLAE